MVEAYYEKTDSRLAVGSWWQGDIRELDTTPLPSDLRDWMYRNLKNIQHGFSKFSRTVLVMRNNKAQYEHVWETCFTSASGAIFVIHQEFLMREQDHKITFDSLCFMERL